MVVVAALYKFVSIPTFRDWREPIRELCTRHHIKGTLLLAAEGINGTIAGERDDMDRFLVALRALPGLADLEHKESFHEKNPFYRLKVKLKKEIVTLGVEGVDPNQQVGTYVDPADWNALISDPNVVVLDTRNDYEYAIGTFDRALDPNTKSFREFPDYVKQHLDPAKHKKIAMFCTGGIRCEKASSYMLAQGFAEVYHLKGGILKYLEEVPVEQSKWQGECFVFDNRVAVNHQLAKGEHEFCPGCRGAVGPDDKQSPKFIENLCCPRCHDSLSEEQKQRFTERKRQIELAKQRGQTHWGGES